MRSTIALAGLAACAHTPDAAPPTSVDMETAADLPAQARAIDEQVAGDLARLDALTLFVVGDLVGGDASEAFNCYGPCEGADADVADYAERAARLRALADMAESMEATEGCPLDDVDDSLDALRALEVVEVGAFVSDQAPASPYCYNLPCPEDEAAAHEANCARAARLDALAAQADGA